MKCIRRGHVNLLGSGFLFRRGLDLDRPWSILKAYPWNQHDIKLHLHKLRRLKGVRRAFEQHREARTLVVL